MIKKLLLASAASALLAGAASAADLPRRAAPPPVFTPIPVFTWTGFFAGADTAYTFTDRQRITTFGNDSVTAGNVLANRRPAGVRNETDGLANIGGGFGYNYQFTPGSGFVVGVAANWTWNDIHKNTLFVGAPLAGSVIPNVSNFRQSLEWLGTATGRIGYAFDRFLVYGFGGFAYGQVQYDANFYNPGLVLQYAGRSTDLETGYAYGGGIEYALPTDSFLNFLSVGKYLGIKSEAVTLKVEYQHYDLGSRSVLVAPTGFAAAVGSYTSRFRTEGDMVKAGFNYKFGGL